MFWAVACASFVQKQSIVKFNRSELIQNLQERTSTLSERVAALKQLPPKALNFKPGEGKWSALECIEHLNMYGDFYLPEIEERLLQAKPSPDANGFSTGVLGGYFVRLMEPKEGKIKSMHTQKQMNPLHSELNITTLDRFLKQQERYLELVKGAERVNLKRVKTSVTISPLIKLRFGDTLRFLVAHNERHVAQAEAAAALAR